MDFAAGRTGGFSSWRLRSGEVEVCFTGKGPRLARPAALRRILPAGVEPAWIEQVHGAAVVDAGPGVNGRGDALVAARCGLALAVVTADCVPVLLAGGGRVAAVHAGWRGLAQSILPATVERFEAPASAVSAWIGPAIGRCCYEVGADVAAQVVAASCREIASDGPCGRPHLDLAAAARLQLERQGVLQVISVAACTRCDAARLWSYRRDGSAAGRNLAVIWRRAATTS